MRRLISNGNGARVRRWAKKLRWLVPFPRHRTVRKYFPKFEDRNVAHLLNESGVSYVLDIGANEGQFAQKLRYCGYRGDIISFEPSNAAYEKLLANARRDRRWRIYPRIAIGDIDGDTLLNVMGLSSLSSTLKPLGAEPIAVERVGMHRLDSIFDELQLDAGRGLAIKLDVQGAESAVLEGSKRARSNARALLIELCLIPTYQGETYYLDILNDLYREGFCAVFFSPVTSRNILGRMYQVDALLLRDAGKIVGL